MKKNQKEEEGDDTNSNVSAWPPDPRPPDDRVGPLHSLPPETATNDPVDPISRPETSSAGPNATRRHSVVPVVKTRLLFRAPQISDQIRRKRTSFSTSFKIHGGVYRIQPKSAQRAYGSDEQRPTSGIRKGEFDQTTFLCARSSSPIYIRGYFFFSSHPPPKGALELELRRCRHTGGLQRSMDTITSHIPDPPASHIRRSHRRYQRGEREFSS